MILILCLFILDAMAFTRNYFRQNTTYNAFYEWGRSTSAMDNVVTRSWWPNFYSPATTTRPWWHRDNATIEITTSTSMFGLSTSSIPRILRNNETAELDYYDEDTLHTNGQKEYKFYPVPIGGPVHLKIKANRNACIALSLYDKPWWPFVEIFVGGWGNERCAIVKNRELPEIIRANVETAGILSDREYRAFWVNWEGGKVAVGYEGNANPFIWWQDPDPFPVKFIGVATVWDTPGDWKIKRIKPTTTPIPTTEVTTETEMQMESTSLVPPETTEKSDYGEIASLVPPEMTEKSDYGNMASLVPPETTEKSAYGEMASLVSPELTEKSDYGNMASLVPPETTEKSAYGEMASLVSPELTEKSDYGNMASLVPPETTEKSDYGKIASLVPPEMTENSDYGKMASLVPPAITEKSDFGEIASLVPPAITAKSDYGKIASLVPPEMTAKSDYGKIASLVPPEMTAKSEYSKIASLVPPEMTENSDYGKMASLVPPELTEKSDYGKMASLVPPEMTEKSDFGEIASLVPPAITEKSDYGEMASLVPPAITEKSDHGERTSLVPPAITEKSDYGEMASLVPPEMAEKSDYGEMASLVPPAITEKSDHGERTSLVPPAITEKSDYGKMASLVTPKVDEKTEKSDYGEMASLVPPETTERSSYNKMTVTQKQGQQSLNDTTKDNESKQHPTHQSPIPTLSAHQVHTTPTTKMPTTLPIHAKMTSDYGEMKSLVPPETTERSDFGAMTVNQDEQKNVNDTNKRDKTQQVPTTSATKMLIPPKMTESSDFGDMKSLVPVETTDRSDYNAMTANQNEQKNVNDTAKDDESKQHPTHQSPIPTLSAHQVHTTPATKMPIPPKMTESSDYGEMKSLIPPETTERSDYGANQDEQKNVNDTNKHDKSKQHPTHQSPIPTLSAHQVHTTPTTKMPIHPKMTLDYGEMKSLVPSETTERSDFGAMTVNQDEQKNMNDTNKHDKTQQVPTSATKMPMPPKMTESSDYGEMKSLGPPKTTDRSDYNAMTANQNEQKNVNDTNKDDISKQHPTQQSPIPTLSAHQVHTTPATKMPATLPINANITSDYSEMKSLVPPETTDRSDYSVMTANQGQDQKNVNETTEDDDSKQLKTTPIPTLSAQQVPETPATKMPTTLPISPKMTESSDYGEKTTERSDYGALTANQNEQKNVNDTNKHDINEQTKTTPILTPTKLPVPPETTKWSDNSEMTANQNLEQQNLNGTNEKKKNSDANLATNSKHQYQFFPVKSESVQFKVKAANDACIALTTGPQESWPIVEICIGGWGNTKSAIYKNRTDYEIFSALSVTNGILDDSKYQGFWVKWDGGIIYVGQEGEIFPFLSWVDPEPFPVRFVGMATAGGATGSWKISDVVNSRDHNYQFFPVSSKSVQIKVKAASDACIALTTEARESWPIVEICIGGWNNTKSAIYRNRIDYDIFSVQAITIGILDTDKYCGIWVQWDRGIICVGRKGEISPFLMWVDPQPFQVSFVGVCTTTGTWKIKATNTTNSTITNYFTTFTKEDASNDKTTKAPTPKFFTIFIMKLLEQIASKEKKEAGNLFVSTKSIVIHLNEAGTFNGFGEELRSHILWATFKLNFFKPEVVQSQAKLKLDMMWNNIIDEDIKDILHLLDSTYTPEEGEKVLLLSLVDLTIYPANNITSQTVVQYLISGILAPYYRLLGTELLALVVRLINEAINRKNIYEDKTNKPRGLKNSEINVDKRKEFKITPSMIINNEIDGRRKIEGDNAIVKIKINMNNTNFHKKQTESEYKGRNEFRNRNKSIYIDTGTVLKIDKHKNKEVDFKKYVKHKIKDHFKNKHSKLYQNYINKHKLPKEQDDTQRKKHKVIDKFDGYHYEKLQRNRYLSEGFGKLYTIAAHKTVGHKNIKRIPTKPMNRQRMVLQKSFYVADTHNRNSEKVTKKRTKPSKNKKEEDASSENYSEKSRYLTIVFTNSGKKQREFKDEKHVLKKKAYRFVNNFKITKKKGIFEDSSYSDEEKELKFMLQDALRHGDRRFIERRNYETTKMKNINDLSSYSDEEAVLKNNIYKVFGYKQRMI